MNKENKINYEVKNVKKFLGWEGYGFECSLYRDGKKVASVVDDAHGGDYKFHWEDWNEPKINATYKDYNGNPMTIDRTPEEKIFYEYIDTLPPTDNPIDGQPMHMDGELFICHMVDEYEINKDFKRKCKKKTLFRLRNQKDNEYMYLNIPWGKEADEYLKKQYPNGELIEIINKRFE